VRVERLDGLEVIVADASGTITFPRGRARSREALDQAVRSGLQSMSWVRMLQPALGRATTTARSGQLFHESEGALERTEGARSCVREGSCLAERLAHAS
jgi:hypothetical protein